MCGNVVFSVTVRRTVILMWTSTEGVNGYRIVVQNLENRYCGFCGNVVFSVTV
jgi:hypothetical protein